MGNLQAERYGVIRDEVTGHHIGPKSFNAIFSGFGELISQGKGKSEIVSRVMDSIYTGLSNEERVRRLQNDIKRAQNGEWIHCEGAEKLLFPEEFE